MLAAARKARNPPRSAPVELSRHFLIMVPEMRRLRKQLAAIAEAWEAVIPADLAARTRLDGAARGVLEVRVPDSGTAYELDRFLRCGGEARVLARAAVSIRKVRVSLESAEPGA
jgi:hypothetical protein